MRYFLHICITRLKEMEVKIFTVGKIVFFTKEKAYIFI